MSDLKKTILSEEHVRLGGRMVEFAGWYMPVQYEGIREEHNTVRTAVGLFDVSHMGEVRVKGKNALATLQWLTTNDVAKLNAGEAQYSLLPNDQGGLVDDIIVYCLTPNEDYLVCVNASNTDKDFDWMVKHNKGADITNESSRWSQIAVQGPKALELVEKVFANSLTNVPPFRLLQSTYAGVSAMIATTGYTGERGCEIFVENAGAVALWQDLLKKGESLGVKPIGLGARDTLRTEMKYSLYGHEISDTTNPYSAGLGWVIKPDAKDFLGKDRFLSEKQAGLKQKLIGFQPTEKGIPRQGYSLFASNNSTGTAIGVVTSGTVSPTLDAPIGIAYVDAEFATVGTEIFVDIRGRKVKAQVVQTPFVKKTSV